MHGALTRAGAWRLPGIVVLVGCALAGCDGPPLGGTPLGVPARTRFAGCPRLEGTYALPDETPTTPSRARGASRIDEPLHDDELNIEPSGNQALRFTWRASGRPDPSVTLRMAPDQLARYRWSTGLDERTDEDFLQILAKNREIRGLGSSVVVARKLIHCEHGWAVVRQVAGAEGMPFWPEGGHANVQFTIDQQGALIADFSAHYSDPGVSSDMLLCGRSCRDALANGRDVHRWIRAPRKIGVGATTLDLPYDEGTDLLAGTSDASEAVRLQWRRRLPGLDATLARVRIDARHVEMTFAANDVRSLVAAPRAMRQVTGLRDVVVRRFSGAAASPQTLTITANIPGA